MINDWFNRKHIKQEREHREAFRHGRVACTKRATTGELPMDAASSCSPSLVQQRPGACRRGSRHLFGEVASFFNTYTVSARRWEELCRYAHY
jgi:hypothetical protein